jgi:diguanylate cyclase (GGDEF)-like protein
MQQDLAHYVDILHVKIRELEQEQENARKKTPAPSASRQVRRIGQALLARRMELQKAEAVQQRLEQLLKADSTPQPYRTVSAWEVVRAMRRAEAGLPPTPEDVELQRRLRNKTIFVGTTAVATYDIKNTSIHSSLPGVILQATLFDNLNRNDGRYVQRATPAANLWITLFICLLAAGLTFRIRSALVGILTTANIGVLYVLLAIILYQSFSLWVNIAMPLLALIVTTTLTFIAKYILRDKDYEKTYALATTDSMTGLYNHRFFQESIHQSIEQASRLKQPFSLLLIDIDLFKRFNDTYGHQAGDTVLRHVARKLQRTVRSLDIVARYGGEEIAIILTRTDEEEALAVARKIVRAVAEEGCPIAEGVTRNVTISCGVATYPRHGGTPSQLIEVADAGLYHAKKNGRNRVGAVPVIHSRVPSDKRIF